MTACGREELSDLKSNNTWMKALRMDFNLWVTLLWSLFCDYSWQNWSQLDHQGGEVTKGSCAHLGFCIHGTTCSQVSLKFQEALANLVGLWFLHVIIGNHGRWKGFVNYKVSYPYNLWSFCPEGSFFAIVRADQSLVRCNCCSICFPVTVLDVKVIIP